MKKEEKKVRKLKRKGKSIFAAVIAVMLAASCLLYTGVAEVQAATSENDFKFEDGTITGYNGNDSEVIIPSTINGKTVTEIRSGAFTFVEGLKAVTIPSTVKKIDYNAFIYCEDLETVTFEGKVAEVEEYGFSVCAEVITFICQKQYESYYEGLSDVLYDSGVIIDASLSNAGATDPTDPSKPDDTKEKIFEVKETDGGCVIESYNVKEGGQAVVIPAEINGKKVVGIADEAFSQTKANVGYAKWITSVTLPDTIKSIGANAFYGCSRVKEIVLPDGLETIGEGAFRYCNSLTEINIPASVKEIGDIAFKQAGGAHLKAINVAVGNQNYKSVDGVLLSEDGKNLICYPTGKVGNPYQMPDSVETIGNDAFRGDPAGLFDGSTQDGKHKLTGIIFSKNLQSIGERAFEQTSLESVTITSDIKIGKLAFSGCKSLKNVTIAEGVTEIPECAFMNMEAIKELKLPSTLKKIGKQAFDRYGAESIELPEGLEEIGESAFAGSKLTSIKLPSTVTTIEARAFISSHVLENVEFAANSKLVSIGEYAFNHCTSLTSVKLPATLESLEDGCFSICPKLTGIQLPENMAVLGDAVFSGSGMTKVVLPDSIWKIGDATFRSCTSLTSVTMPEELEELGNCTFEDCSNLTDVTFKENMDLTYVPSDTFFNCKSIEKIYLPKVIAETKACAFSNCDKNPTIEYANANLKRSPFDCYAIDPGEAYRLGEDGFYYTTEEIEDSNFSEGIFGDIQDETNTQARYGNSVIFSKTAGSAIATCGCGSNLGANIKLSPSSNPKFVYKPAGSGSSAAGGSNGGSGNGNGASTIGTGNGNGTGSGTGAPSASVTGKKNTSPKVTARVAAKTGDETFVGGYIVLIVLALMAGTVVLVYRRKKVEQR